MFYLCKTMLGSDFYTKVLCTSANFYLVQSASISMYCIEGGRFEHMKTVQFFDVIKSADIVGDRVLVVFNGYLSVLDCLLNDERRPSLISDDGTQYSIQTFVNEGRVRTKNGSKAMLPVVDRYRFGRSSIDYRNVGAYFANTDQTVCLVSLFGQMLFYTIDMGLIDPIEYSTSSVVLDFKALKGPGLYLSLERANERVFLRVYEHKSGVITLKSEINVPGGYLIALLEEGLFAVFATNKVFVVNGFKDVEAYEISKAMVGGPIKEDLGEDRDGVSDPGLFTCFSSYGTPRYSLTLALNEVGEIFSVEIKDGFRLTYITRISPSKDIRIHPEGFLITIGYNTDNCIYHLGQTGDGRVTLELTDTLEVFGISRTSTITFSKLYQIYMSNSRWIREVVQRNSLVLVSRLELPDECKGSLREIFGAGRFVCAVCDKYIYNMVVDIRELTVLYKLKLADELVGYFRFKGLDLYLTNSLIVIVEIHDKKTIGPDDGKEEKQLTVMKLPEDSSFSIRELSVRYDVFSTSESSLFLAYENEITKVTLGMAENIQLNFMIKGLASSDQYLFILTGRRVLRVYDILSRKYVFIQAFQIDITFLGLFHGVLYAMGAKTYKFRVAGDGSLSLPVQVKFNGIPIGVKGGLLLLKDMVVDLESEQMMDLDGDMSTLVEDKIVVADSDELKMYKHESSRRFSLHTLANHGEYRIVSKERIYIENVNGTFRIKGFDGSSIIEGSGKAIDFSSSEYQIVAVLYGNSLSYSTNISDSESSLQVYKDGVFLYELRTSVKAEVVLTEEKMVYYGSDRILYGYKVGKKALLKKFKLVLPSRITTICFSDSRIFVGTEKDSVCVVKGWKLVCSEQLPRHVTALDAICQNRLIVGDKVGNILIMEVLGDSLRAKACLFVNDMPMQFVCGDRIFVVCLSGKVCEIVEIDDVLFGLFEKVERQILECLGKPFFEIFKRNGFVDSEYLKLFYELDDKQTKKASELIGVSIEKIFEAIDLL